MKSLYSLFAALYLSGIAIAVTNFEIGNDQLRFAWNAAQNQIFLNNEYAAIIAGVEGLNIPTDCIPSPTAYPFPQPPFVGTFANVLATKIVRLTYPIPFNETSPETIALFTRVIQLIGQHYNVSLNISVNVVSTSDDCFAALQNGTADLVGPDFGIGAFFNGSPRTYVFSISCPTFSGIDFISVRSSLNITNVDQLLAYSQNHTLVLSASGTADAATAAAAFPKAIIIDEDDDTVVVALINNGTIDGVFDSDSSLSALTSVPLVLFTSNVPFTQATFFRKEACV